METILTALLGIVMVTMAVGLTIGLVGMPFYIIYQLIMWRDDEEPELEKPIIKFRYNRAPEFEKAGIRRTLEGAFPYYKELTHELQERFIRRVWTFLNAKKIVSRSEHGDISDELRVLIAACAVQITFGFRAFLFDHFRTILVYPDIYYSKIRRQYHKGEVNARRGLIVLSGKHFLEGYLEPHDGINLGLHELTHAVQLEHTVVQEYEDYISNYEHWAVAAEFVQDLIKNDEIEFIRDYATTDMHEMLAVTTEVFFEQPEMLYEKIPMLYKRMAKLYNQDPRNKKQPVGV